MILERHFAGNAVAVIGGLGFIGSNPPAEVARLGARVTVFDASLELAAMRSDPPHASHDVATLSNAREQIAISAAPRALAEVTAWAREATLRSGLRPAVDDVGEHADLYWKRVV